MRGHPALNSTPLKRPQTRFGTFRWRLSWPGTSLESFSLGIARKESADVD